MAPFPLSALLVVVPCMVLQFFLDITFLLLSRVPGSQRIYDWLNAQLWLRGNASINVAVSWQQWLSVARSTPVWRERIRRYLSASWTAQVATFPFLMLFGRQMEWLVASLLFGIVPTVAVGLCIPALRRQTREALAARESLWNTGKPQSSTPDYRKFFDHPVA